MANGTSLVIAEDYYWPLKVTTSIFGGIIFTANLCIIYFLMKLFLSQQSYKDKYGFFIHLTFVLINDTLCGLTLFLVGIISVEDISSARMCAILLFLSFSLQLVSQINIACVCIQRFMLSKSIASTHGQWKSVYTKILFVANVEIGIMAFVIYLTRVDVLYNEYTIGSCFWSRVADPSAGHIALISFFIGMTFTFIGDVLCAFIFWRLRKRVHASIDSEVNTAGTTVESNSNNTIQLSTRRRQQRAMVTLLLVVVFFNLSLLPYLTGFIVGIVFKVPLPNIVFRIMFLTLFTNSVANPLIIVTRIGEVRSSINTTARRILGNIERCCENLRKRRD
mgnify:FL=1